MVRAVTFGASKDDRGDGIHLQYDLVELKKGYDKLIVHTSKRKTVYGQQTQDG